MRQVINTTSMMNRYERIAKLLIKEALQANREKGGNSDVTIHKKTREHKRSNLSSNAISSSSSRRR